MNLYEEAEQATLIRALQQQVSALREALREISNLPLIVAGATALGIARKAVAQSPGIKGVECSVCGHTPWISVKDRLPEVGPMHNFLVWIPNDSKLSGYRELAAYGEWICKIEHLDESDPRFVRDNDDGNCKGFGWNREEDTHGGPYDYIVLDLNDKVTHWMPLPEQPSPEPAPEVKP